VTRLYVGGDSDRIGCVHRWASRAGAGRSNSNRLSPLTAPVGS
jgi:hypothetical protein